MLRAALLVLLVLLVWSGMTRNRRGWARRTLRPSGGKELVLTLVGLVGTGVWLAYEPLVERLGVPHTVPDPALSRYVGGVFGGVTAIIAARKQRNALAWFAAGAWFLILGLVAVVFLPKLTEESGRLASTERGTIQ